jgi:stearoyl-CoA desaturase (delta-9 desaturase)
VHRPTRIPLSSPSRGRWLALLHGGALVALHAGAVAAFARGASVKLVALGAGVLAMQFLAIGVGYRRYFAHRSFEASRAVQLFLAVLGTTAAQKGPLFWASAHRMRHRRLATARDVHSAADRIRRLVADACSWLAYAHEATRLDTVADFAGYPELRIVDRSSLLGPLAMIALLLPFGIDAVLWGYAVPTCVCLHATFLLDSFDRSCDTASVQHESTDAKALT